MNKKIAIRAILISSIIFLPGNFLGKKEQVSINFIKEILNKSDFCCSITSETKLYSLYYKNDVRIIWYVNRPLETGHENQAIIILDHERYKLDYSGMAADACWLGRSEILCRDANFGTVDRLKISELLNGERILVSGYLLDAHRSKSLRPVSDHPTFPQVNIIGSGATTMRRISPETTAHLRCLDSGDAAQGVSVAMFDCNHQEIDRQYAEMTILVRQIMGKLSSAQQKVLDAAQKRWMIGRDRHCGKEADRMVGRGGTDNILVFHGCLITENKRRIASLQQRYQRPESTFP